MAIDVATFKPKSVDEFLDGLLEVSIGAAKKAWDKIRDTVSHHLEYIAKRVAQTADWLAKKQIDKREADRTLTILQADFNLSLLQMRTLPYAVGQGILNAVFGLIKAAIKNLTGVDLNF